MSAVLGVALPGTFITPLVEKVFFENEPRAKDESLPVVKLGTGLVQSGEDILAVGAGLLYHQKPNKFWIEGRQKRYIPAPNDLVVGIVTARLAEAYKIDLGSNGPATLNFSGFEGTTKKNRPNLSIGDVVYARVSLSNRYIEPELVCFDTDNRSDGFGEVKDGMLYRCSCNLSRKLQILGNSTLEVLGQHFAFEIIVGANGRFILNAEKPMDVIKIANIILDSEGRNVKWVTEKIKEVARSK